MPSPRPLESLTGGTLRGVALALLAWLALAVTATAMVFTAVSGSSFAQWLELFRPILVYWILWAVTAALVYRIVVYVPFSRRFGVWAVAAHGATLSVFTLAVPVLLFQAFPWDWLATAQAQRFHRMNVPIYVFVALACLLLKHYRLAIAKERRAAEMALEASELASQLSRVRLEALQSRIHPHFLFNALNGIAALIETRRNDEAYRATELLGGLLRDTLDHEHETLVPLSDELAFVRRYIEIESVRFGERLRYSEDVDPRCGPLPVPSLILLPLVENAVKHGVSNVSEPVTVSVRAEVAEGRMRITVADSGPGMKPETSTSNGVGLRTTEERLSLQYGASYGLSITDLVPRGAVVCLHIPADVECSP